MVHSVRVGQVRIPARTLLFRFRIAVYLFSLGVGLSLRMSNRMMLFLLLSKWLSSFNIVNISILIF